MKLPSYLTRAIPDVSYTFEQLKSSPHGHNIRLLIHSLADNSRNPLIIAALMYVTGCVLDVTMETNRPQRILKWQFDNTPDADWGVNESRGYACEYVAWQFLCHLTQDEHIEFLLQELPGPQHRSVSFSQAEEGTSGFRIHNDNYQSDSERTPLLKSSSLSRFFSRRRSVDSYSARVPEQAGTRDDTHGLERLSLFFGLNVLEIAIIVHAKKFLSQKVVQRVVDNIWKGEIVFWDSLSVQSRKRPHFFNEK